MLRRIAASRSRNSNSSTLSGVGKVSRGGVERFINILY